MKRSGLEALILGVGNLLWADEGFGVRCVERFASSFDLPDTMEAIDGGTQGLALVNALAECKRLLLFDAVDAGLEPGELVVVRGDNVPKFVAGRKVSLHQTSMMEILALAELMADGPPGAITLIGCQPVELEDYGGGLTATVASRVDEAIQRAVEELSDWGLPVTPKQDLTTGVMPDAVGWQPYEAGRPSEQVACRIGDDRVLSRLAERGL